MIRLALLNPTTISSGDPTTKLPTSHSHLGTLSCLVHASCCLPTPQRIFYRQSMYKYQVHASYRFYTTLHTFSRLSIYTPHFHAFGCLPTIPCTIVHHSKHKFQSHLSYCPSKFQSNNCRPSRHIYPPHFFCLQSSVHHIYCHQPRFIFPCRADNHQAISLRTWLR